MGSAAYMHVTEAGIEPKYSVPKVEDEKIFCDFCEEEVPIVISVGTLWLCEPCYDQAKEAWNGIRKGGKR